jgi:hypothetical protein
VSCATAGEGCAATTAAVAATAAASGIEVATEATSPAASSRLPLFRRRWQQTHEQQKLHQERRGNKNNTEVCVSTKAPTAEAATTLTPAAAAARRDVAPIEVTRTGKTCPCPARSPRGSPPQRSGQHLRWPFASPPSPPWQGIRKDLQSDSI